MEFGLHKYRLSKVKGGKFPPFLLNMPAIVRSEFALALNQVATERGIDPAVVLETIKAAILAAYRKDYGEDELEKFSVELNSDNGEAKIFKDEKDVTPPGFGRIAAQTAKQVILQRIREAEKQAILTDYTTKVGSVLSGMVLRFDGPNIVVDIGRAQAVMPPNEQVPNERYQLNQRLSFYIEGIRETYRGNEIIVSRAHKNLVSGLFKREVPEVSQGAVEIREIAREPGSRTKVAVFSTQSGVDPVGSCVGQKGVRVQAVISELGGEEKIDIIQWNDDLAHFITAALAPAKELSVTLNEPTKTASVLVPDAQLSLAIGREGQNVRLAAKLTGWRIDLKGKGDTVKVTAEKEAEVAALPADIDAKDSAAKAIDQTETASTSTSSTVVDPTQQNAQVQKGPAQTSSATANPQDPVVPAQTNTDPQLADATVSGSQATSDQSVSTPTTDKNSGTQSS